MPAAEINVIVLTITSVLCLFELTSSLSLPAAAHDVTRQGAARGHIPLQSANWPPETVAEGQNNIATAAETKSTDARKLSSALPVGKNKTEEKNFEKPRHDLNSSQILTTADNADIDKRRFVQERQSILTADNNNNNNHESKQVDTIRYRADDRYDVIAATVPASDMPNYYNWQNSDVDASYLVRNSVDGFYLPFDLPAPVGLLSGPGMLHSTDYVEGNGQYGKQPVASMMSQYDYDVRQLVDRDDVINVTSFGENTTTSQLNIVNRTFSDAIFKQQLADEDGTSDQEPADEQEDDEPEIEGRQANEEYDRVDYETQADDDINDEESEVVEEVHRVNKHKGRKKVPPPPPSQTHSHKNRNVNRRRPPTANKKTSKRPPTTNKHQSNRRKPATSPQTSLFPAGGGFTAGPPSHSQPGQLGSSVLQPSPQNSASFFSGSNSNGLLFQPQQQQSLPHLYQFSSSAQQQQQQQLPQLEQRFTTAADTSRGFLFPSPSLSLTANGGDALLGSSSSSLNGGNGGGLSLAGQQQQQQQLQQQQQFNAGQQNSLDFNQLGQAGSQGQVGGVQGFGQSPSSSSTATGGQFQQPSQLSPSSQNFQQQQQQFGGFANSGTAGGFIQPQLNAGGIFAGAAGVVGGTARQGDGSGGSNGDFDGFQQAQQYDGLIPIPSIPTDDEYSLQNGGGGYFLQPDFVDPSLTQGDSLASAQYGTGRPYANTDGTLSTSQRPTTRSEAAATLNNNFTPPNSPRRRRKQQQQHQQDPQQLPAKLSGRKKTRTSSSGKRFANGGPQLKQREIPDENENGGDDGKEAGNNDAISNEADGQNDDENAVAADQEVDEQAASGPDAALGAGGDWGQIKTGFEEDSNEAGGETAGGGDENEDNAAADEADGDNEGQQNDENANNEDDDDDAKNKNAKRNGAGQLKAKQNTTPISLTTPFRLPPAAPPAVKNQNDNQVTAATASLTLDSSKFANQEIYSAAATTQSVIDATTRANSVTTTSLPKSVAPSNLTSTAVVEGALNATTTSRRKSTKARTTTTTSADDASVEAEVTSRSTATSKRLAKATTVTPATSFSSTLSSQTEHDTTIPTILAAHRRRRLP